MFRETFLPAPRVLQSILQRQGVGVTLPTCFGRFRLISTHGHGGGSFLKTKAELRAAMIAARSSLSLAFRQEASAQIVRRIVEHAVFARAQRISVYSAIRAEADPLALAEAALAAHKE